MNVVFFLLPNVYTYAQTISRSYLCILTIVVLFDYIMIIIVLNCVIFLRLFFWLMLLLLLLLPLFFFFKHFRFLYYVIYWFYICSSPLWAFWSIHNFNFLPLVRSIDRSIDRPNCVWVCLHVNACTNCLCICVSDIVCFSSSSLAKPPTNQTQYAKMKHKQQTD